MKSNRFRAAAPSLVTSGNLVIGLVSIALAASGHLEGAAWAIVYCGILDKADGSLARALNVQGAFGMEMDSFADYTSFGLAPAALCWFLCSSRAAGSTDLPAWIVAWFAVCSVMFPIAAAVRLARFNVLTHEDPSFFAGVPTTMVAGLYATLYLSLVDLHDPVDPLWVMPPAAVAAAALMVCGIRIPKLKGKRQHWKNVLLVSTLLLLAGLAVFQMLPELMFALGSLYLVVGWLRSRGAGGQGPGLGVSSAPGGDA